MSTTERAGRRPCRACGTSSADCDARYEATEMTTGELCCRTCEVEDTSVLHSPVSATIRATVAGRADVYCDGCHVGEVRRVSETYVSPYMACGVAERTVWRAVPLSRVAHASSAGCPSFHTRREAAEALARGAVTL